MTDKINWGHVSLGRAFCASFCGLLALGCASVDEKESEAKEVPPPLQGQTTSPQTWAAPKALLAQPAQNREIAQLAAPALWQSRALRHLTPELLRAASLSGAISNHAGRDYEAAVARIRGDASQGRALRAFYEELPVDAYSPRQQAIHLVGMIGTGEDVPMLEGVAMSPLSLPEPATSEEEGDQPATIDQEGQLRNAAIVALSRIAQRGDKPALAALVRLLADGDKEAAILAGVELADFGKLGATERKLLSARGITGSFAKMDFEKTFKLDPPADNGNGRPAVVPPVAP